MSAIGGALLGAAATAAFAAGCYVGWKAWLWMVGWYSLILRGVRAAEGIQQELAYMRGLTGGTLPDMHVGGDPEDAVGPQPVPAMTSRARGFHPFPEPIMDRFAVQPEPDATKEDTDMDLLAQDDRDLAAMEVLENLRQRGIEVEDSDTVHPGITVDAK